MTLVISGIGICQGIVSGQARVITTSFPAPTKLQLSKNEAELQVLRYQAALAIATQQLNAIRQQVTHEISVDIASFIDAHLLMIQDVALTQGTIQIIRTELCNAEWALHMQREVLIEIFEQVEDEYIRTRQDDIDHVIARIQHILHYGPSHPEAFNQLENSSHKIIISDKISAADLILLKTQGAQGVIIEQGGPTSHTAILARSLNIPCVIGAHHACQYANDGDIVLMDGEQGLVIVAPSPNVIEFFTRKDKLQQQKNDELQQLSSLKAATQDGTAVTLRANMELPQDIDSAHQVQAEGIGLYRTEYLFMRQSQMPNEEEQFEHYLGIIKAMAPHPVTIRTIDLGSDKQASWLKKAGLNPMKNPALGLRAIRLCLHTPEIFIPQLRAILRASHYGTVRLLLPMLTCAQEIIQVKELLEKIKYELQEENIPFDTKMPLGGMIETPAAALMADVFAKHLDFFSLGTNDLIQYTLAIDRENDTVNYLYEPIHPAVLTLIKKTINAANKKSIPVALCGEMGGDPRYTRLLLGLGLREFSVQPAFLLAVKAGIYKTVLDQKLTRHINLLMKTPTPGERKEVLDRINEL